MKSGNALRSTEDIIPVRRMALPPSNLSFQALPLEQIAGKFGYTNADNAKNQKSKCMDKLRKIVKNYAVNQL